MKKSLYISLISLITLLFVACSDSKSDKADSEKVKSFETTVSIDNPDIFTPETGREFLYLNYKIKFDGEKINVVKPDRGEEPEFVTKYSKASKDNFGIDLEYRKICGLDSEDDSAGPESVFDLVKGKLVVIYCHNDGGDNAYFTLVVINDDKKLVASKILKENEQPFSCSFDRARLKRNVIEYGPVGPVFDFESLTNGSYQLNTVCAKAEFVNEETLNIAQ